MKIKLLCMDVDGTLTDGKIYISNSGELVKAFDVKDGYGISHVLSQNNIMPVIITGRISEIVLKRAVELGVEEVYQGVVDKNIILQTLIQKYRCEYDEIAYIGDDFPDLECIKKCGISGCPGDAVDDIKKVCDYVCLKKSGDGAVREFIDWLVIHG